MISITVIISTKREQIFNLRRLLLSLKLQDLNYKDWEIIIVNHSDRLLAEDNIDLSWQPQSQIINTLNKSLGESRFKGIENATGDNLILLEENLLLERDYLTQVLTIINDKPYIGAFYGSIKPQFEQGDHSLYYSLNDKFYLEGKQTVISNLPVISIAPIGSGLVLKTALVKNYSNNFYLNFGKHLEDWQGQNYLEVSDLVLCNQVLKADYLIGFFPQLSLVCMISNLKISKKEIQSSLMARYIGIHQLNYINFQKWPTGLSQFNYFIHQIRNVIIKNKENIFLAWIERKSFLNSVKIAFVLRKLKNSNGY